MNATDDRAIREQLERAVEVIEPVAPPLDGLRSLARRRRRARRFGAGFLAVAAMAAVVVIAVVVVPGGSGNQTVRTANAPTRASLVAFAHSQGALKLAGPFEATNGWYGAYATRSGIAVADYRSDTWRQMGATVTSLGSGRWVNLLRFAPALQVAGDPRSLETPTVYLRVIGGDISYAGSVLRLAHGVWQTAVFGGCGHQGLCHPPGNAEPYLHHAGAGLISVHNDCTPYCAAGTDYQVRWAWSPTRERFVAVAVTRLSQ